MYVLELFFLGEKKYITVDDRLAVGDYYWYPDEKSLINAKVSDSGAWWLTILEKGIAKHFSNFLALDGGRETIALRAMTGMPVDRFATASYSEEQVFNMIA